MGEITRNGLIAEYHFDGNAKDSSEKGNNGSVSGSVYIDGKFGQALSFDGENDFVRVPDSISLNPTSLTIEAWIFVNSSKSSWHSILTKMDKLQDSGYELYIIQQNIPRFGLVSKGTKKVTDGNYIPLNKWTYIAATYDRRALVLYVNGEFDSYDEKTGFLGTASKEDLYIGSWGDVDYFSGAIDEVRIYNRALSDLEIKENFKSAINPVNQTTTPSITTEPTIQPTATIEISTPAITSNPAPVPKLTQEPTPLMTKKSPGFSSIFVFMAFFFCILFLRRFS